MLTEAVIVLVMCGCVIVIRKFGLSIMNNQVIHLRDEAKFPLLLKSQLRLPY
jgi:hypothetical protein